MEQRILIGVSQNRRGEIFEEEFVTDYIPDKAFQIYCDRLHKHNNSQSKKYKIRTTYSFRVPVSARWKEVNENENK